jgi:hypothetical protein
MLTDVRDANIGTGAISKKAFRKKRELFYEKEVSRKGAKEKRRQELYFAALLPGAFA